MRGTMRTTPELSGAAVRLDEADEITTASASMTGWANEYTTNGITAIQARSQVINAGNHRLPAARNHACWQGFPYCSKVFRGGGKSAPVGYEF